MTSSRFTRKSRRRSPTGCTSRSTMATPRGPSRARRIWRPTITFYGNARSQPKKSRLATTELQAAVRLDLEYAPAHALLATVLSAIGFCGIAPGYDVFRGPNARPNERSRSMPRCRLRHQPRASSASCRTATSRDRTAACTSSTLATFAQATRSTRSATVSITPARVRARRAGLKTSMNVAQTDASRERLRAGRGRSAPSALSSAVAVSRSRHRETQAAITVAIRVPPTWRYTAPSRVRIRCRTPRAVERQSQHRGDGARFRDGSGSPMKKL